MYAADQSDDPLKTGFARNGILARRLFDKGVRFVQLSGGAYQTGGEGVSNWDRYKVLESSYARHEAILDQPLAALLTDLKQRGLLDHTLVVWCTELGRMPTFQQGASGRDHSPSGFACWAGRWRCKSSAVLRRDRSVWTPRGGGRQACLRCTCDGVASAGTGPSTADLFSQWDRTSTARRTRSGDQARARLDRSRAPDLGD